MLRLVIEDGEGTTHVVPLIRDEITVGRQEGNTIRLTERNVSRRHARLTRTGTDDASPVIIEDLHSYNGVRVNGERIAGQCSLRADDTVQIGDYFLALEAEARSAPSPMDTVVTAMNLAEVSAPLAEDAAARLIVVSSNLAGQEYLLKHRENLVGRTETDDNQVVINHRSISRNHAKIIWRDGQFTILDLASANGLIINGQALSSASLVNGDIIEMGHVKFRFSAPGDDYHFTMADVDDVVLPPNETTMRVLAIGVILLVIALAAYVLTDSLEPDQNMGRRPAVTQTDPSSNAQPNIVNPVQETAQPGQIEAQLLVQAREQQDNRNWSAARSIYQKILSMTPGQPAAKKGLARVEAETENRRLKRAVENAVEKRRWQEAYDISSNFDPLSVYRDDIVSLRRDIQKKLAAGLSEKAQSAIKAGRIADARREIKLLEQYRFAKEEAARLYGLIDDRKQKARAAESRATPPKKVTPKKRKRSAKEKRKSARRAARPKPVKVSGPCNSYNKCLSLAKKTYFKPGKKTPEHFRSVAKMYREAIRINPRKKEAYMHLCTILDQKLRDRRSALNVCEKWAKRENNPAQKDAAQRRIRVLKQALGL